MPGPAPKYTRILSIDGGGIRGIIPAQVLVSLEKKLQRKSGNRNARLADHFDLVAGTSTGGILACVYLCPDSQHANQSRFSAEEAVKLYFERGDEIFEIPYWHRVRTLGGVTDEKFPANGLEDALEDYLANLKLSQLRKPCLITAYDIRRRKAHFFKQRKARKARGRNFYVKDVARATSAAPTFFELAKIKSMTNVPYPLIDGGVFANNPTLCAYAEARNLPHKPTAKDMVILSLGTGQAEKAFRYKDAKDWGLVQWVRPLIDIMMGGVSETVDYQLSEIYDAVGKPDQYLRINADLAHEEESVSEMDNAEPTNLARLKEIGTELAEDNSEELDEFVKLLTATKL